MANGVLGMTPKLGKRKKTQVMRAALYCPTPIPFLPSVSWLIFPLLLSCPCCYSRGRTQLKMCTTADTQSRTRHRKLNQVDLPDNMHRPAQGTSIWELFHYPHGTGLHAEQQPAQQGAEPGLRLRPVGSLLQSCRALEVEYITHCMAVISLRAMQEGTGANTEQIHSQGGVRGL